LLLLLPLLVQLLLKLLLKLLLPLLLNHLLDRLLSHWLKLLLKQLQNVLLQLLLLLLLKLLLLLLLKLLLLPLLLLPLLLLLPPLSSQELLLHLSSDRHQAHQSVTVMALGVCRSCCMGAICGAAGAEAYEYGEQQFQALLTCNMTKILESNCGAFT
jgi:hypothetical protein